MLHAKRPENVFFFNGGNGPEAFCFQLKPSTTVKRKVLDFVFVQKRPQKNTSRPSLLISFFALLGKPTKCCKNI
jgi:hypothetical protein